MSENLHGLIISAEELARIRTACQRRAAELAAAGPPQPVAIVPGSLQSVSTALPASPPIPEAERFAAALETMAANVRRFFQYEEPIVSPRQLESAQERLEREERTSFGGWAGG